MQRGPKTVVSSAVVFSTVHRSATDALFAAAERRGQAIVSGKTLMDRNAPAALRDDPESGTRDSNAVNLGLDEEIGSLEPGRWADVVVLDPAATPVLEARHALSESLEDTLFALAILGDDRAVRATYIAGRRVWGE